MITFLQGLQISTAGKIRLILAAGSGFAFSVPVGIILWTALNKLTNLIPHSAIYSGVRSFLSDDKHAKIPLAVRRALQLQHRQEELPPWIRGWMEQVEGRIKRSGVHIPVGRYILGMFLGSIVGVVMGGFLLHNLAAAVILGLSAFLVPDVILVGYIQKRRFKIIDQLGAAVRIFSAELNDTPQVVRALSHTAQRLPKPLGDILGRGSRELTAGVNKDEVLSSMMAELDFDYGRIFVQLLRMAWDDASVKPLFARLATRIAGVQTLMAKNNSSLAYGRFMGLGVNLLILPVFLLVKWKMPGAGEFMVGHSAGRLLVSISFLSILVGLILDRVLSGVKL
ncbi:MAG: type II secretion system F family protein [Bacillota bacterium]